MDSSKRVSRKQVGDDQTRSKTSNSGQDQELLEVLSDWVGKLKAAQDNPAGYAHEMTSLASITTVRAKPSNKEVNSAVSRKEKALSQKVPVALQPLTGALPSISIPDKKYIQKQPQPLQSMSSSVSSSQQSLSAVYGQNLADTSKTTKLSTLLMRIGELLHDNPSIMASFGITTRGRIDDLLGPMELQIKLSGLLGMKISHQEVVLLMNRFGTAGVTGDKVDVVEVLSWARSSYERVHHEKHYQREVEKTRKEVQRLMRRNHVQTKTERKRILSKELDKKVELKLSLASFSLINGNDKSSEILEKTDDIISVDLFKSLLPKMELFLSNLEFNHLVSHYILGTSEQDKNYVNFDMFRGTIIDLAKDAVKVARQEKAVSEFKSALSKGMLSSDQSSIGSASEILEMIDSFQDDESGTHYSSYKKSLDHHQNHNDHDHHHNKGKVHGSRYESTAELEILSDDSLNVNPSIHSLDRKHVRFGSHMSNDMSGPISSNNFRRTNREAEDDVLDINSLPTILTQQQQLLPSLLITTSLSPSKSQQSQGSLGKPSPKQKPSVDSVLDWIADPLDSKQGPGTSLSPIHSNKLRVPALSVQGGSVAGQPMNSSSKALNIPRQPTRLTKLGMADGTA